jgi:hypothetical protein
MKDHKDIVHKRGMNFCDTLPLSNWADGADIVKFHSQWRFVSCPKCIEKGTKRIPKALLTGVK